MDVTAAYHGNNARSMEAHQSVIPHKEAMQAAILGYISRQEGLGATCDEIESVMGYTHQSASARVTELKALGKIVDSGLKRKTRSGRNATVYVHSKIKQLSIF